jgi:hypothetical protein
MRAHPGESLVVKSCGVAVPGPRGVTGEDSHASR